MQPRFLKDRRVKTIVATPLDADYGNISTKLLTVEGLRAQFNVQKDLASGPNKAEIKITNISERTRSGLQEKGGKVLLFAGYESNQALIFRGDIRTIDHVREGPHWVTQIEAGDGERAYLNGFISESFAPGITIPNVIKVACKRLGLDISDVDASIKGLAGKQFDNGYVAHGKASNTLDRVLGAFGWTWSIQDDKVQILAPDGSTQTRVVVLSSASGLVGSPVHVTPERRHSASTTGHARTPAKPKAPYLKFTALLSPEIRPGHLVEIQSEEIHGVYRVRKVRHEGDTAGKHWYTHGEADVTPTKVAA